MIFWLLMTSLSWKLQFYKMCFLEICRTIFIIPPKIWTLPFISFFPPFFKNRFCYGNGKKGMFLHAFYLSFDARFAKYYQSSLHYHKQCPINNIKIKCQQTDQNVSDSFWTCPLKIVPYKLRGLLISSFWSCDSDFR